MGIPPLEREQRLLLLLSSNCISWCCGFVSNLLIGLVLSLHCVAIKGLEDLRKIGNIRKKSLICLGKMVIFLIFNVKESSNFLLKSI